ncbi:MULTISPECIES: hypothetical protein [Maribacter]|uniref:Uncharacterized protein n=2 Tax=Maribacter TaxID=252356 RepID=A0A5R8M9K5_9FLAO|nr:MULTISPECIES: hypothetical protein [Maribacter]KAA2219028.1 hypothetical protein F0361_05290 [Maribacter flavus]TLF46254.1 hypothetical protein FEK29_00300 [Maribacter aurantiacus]
MKNSLTIQVTHSGTDTTKRKSVLSIFYNSLLAEFKKNQSGYSALAIIGQSCLGSAAVMLLLMHEMHILIKMGLVFLVTLFCLLFNASVLVQLKPKASFNLLIMSVFFSFTVILANLI